MLEPFQKKGDHNEGLIQLSCWLECCPAYVFEMTAGMDPEKTFNLCRGSLALSTSLLHREPLSLCQLI